MHEASVWRDVLDPCRSCRNCPKCGVRNDWLLRHRASLTAARERVDHDLMNLPWRRKPLPTGEALESEAARLGVSLHEIYKGGAQGNTILDEPELQRRVLAALGERRSAVLSFVQTAGLIFALLLTLGLALWNAHRESERESADLILRFNELLNSGGSGRIIKALDLDGNLDHLAFGGEALDDAIDDLLSDYELLDAAYRNKLIDNDTAYDAFSYDLEKALRDPKVRQYLSASIGKQSDVYSGVLELAAAWKLTYPVILPAHTTPTARVTPTPGAR